MEDQMTNPTSIKITVTATGPQGTGKTSALNALASTLLAQGFVNNPNEKDREEHTCVFVKDLVK